MEKLYTMVWMGLSRETRNKLREAFSISQSGISEVRDQEVISDGTTNMDLEAINKETMAAYTGSSTEESFLRLWEITLSKVKTELNPPVELKPDPVLEPITDPIKPEPAPVVKDETLTETVTKMVIDGQIDPTHVTDPVVEEKLPPLEFKSTTDAKITKNK